MRKIQLLDEILVQAGFRESMAGTALLREAILAYTPGKHIYKEVYPEAARRSGATAARCERNMRAAVGAAFRSGRCSPDARKYFALREGEVPTVGEAIARLHRVWTINAAMEGCE